MLVGGCTGGSDVCDVAGTPWAHQSEVHPAMDHDLGHLPALNTPGGLPPLPLWPTCAAIGRRFDPSGGRGGLSAPRMTTLPPRGRSHVGDLLANHSTVFNDLGLSREGSDELVKAPEGSLDGGLPPWSFDDIWTRKRLQ